MKKSQITYLILFFVLLICEVLIALFIDDNFIRPYGGDILVTILLCALVRGFIPDRIKLLPVYVFIFAVMVEVGQYFDYVKLLGLEKSRFFTVLLGTSFSWHDILCYGVGCMAFFGFDIIIKKKVLR